MPRENSFSDSDGRSLTPDLEDAEPGLVVGTATPVQVATPQVIDAKDAAQTEIIAPKPSTPPGNGTVAFLDQMHPPVAAATDPLPSSPKRDSGSERVPGAALSKFRASVRKVVHLNRTSSAISTYGIGAEPGVDPRRASAHINYGHIQARCRIEVTDYSTVRSFNSTMDNQGFIKFMEKPQRESWVRVRWINIFGISWDVLSTLALKYQLHPLSVEDVIHQRNANARSKADYYQRHLFIRVLRHCLSDTNSQQTEFMPHSVTGLPRSSSPVPTDSDDEKTEANLSTSKLSLKKGDKDIESGIPVRIVKGRTTTGLRTAREQTAKSITVDELKRGRVSVDTKPLYLYLFRDGTVISIQSEADDFTAPITARLRQRDTGLRATADASLLVQSLLDLVVDQALEVVDEYQKRILDLEHVVLLKPKITAVRLLHILSGDLTLIKRTLEPIKTLVYGLRRYDVDRCAALIDTSSGDKKVVEGFMSHKSKIYLADVYDHMEYILSSLDMFSSIAENLINFTFNMNSADMNEVMRRLTLATIIFLPLTLLTGYFGMNFDSMWSVHHGHSDVIFWIIALPLMAIVISIFLWSDGVRMVHYLQKKVLSKKIYESVKKNQ